MKSVLALFGLAMSFNAYALDPIIPTALEVDTVRSTIQFELQARNMTLVPDSLEIRTSANIPVNVIAALGSVVTFVHSSGNRVKFVDLHYAKFLAKNAQGELSEGWNYVTVQRYNTEKEAQKNAVASQDLNPTSINKVVLNPLAGNAALITMRNRMASVNSDDNGLKMHLVSTEPSSGAGPIEPLVSTSTKTDFMREALTARLSAQGMTLIPDSVQITESAHIGAHLVRLLSDAGAFIKSHGDRMKNVEFEIVKFLAKDKSGNLSEGYTYLFSNGGYTSLAKAQDAVENDNLVAGAASKALINPYTGGAVELMSRGEIFGTSESDYSELHLNVRDN